MTALAALMERGTPVDTEILTALDERIAGLDFRI